MQHLAVIMDGNGRWAQKRHLPRLMGHRAGADALDRTMHWCKEAGIKYLTVYAFSTENWKRSEDEVSGLMKLLSHFIKSKEKELVENGVAFRVIGRRTDLSEKLQKEIAALEEKTKGGDFTLIVALSYGGRDEIVRAAERLFEKWRRGNMPRREDQVLTRQDAASPIDEQTFASCLDTAGIPDPDLIIRTSGELRLSNFLLWQAAYAEFYFTDVLWPDFDKAEFDKAIASFSKRDRRMGGRGK
jgi:undecaprenyl diphosphate synthase